MRAMPEKDDKTKAQDDSRLIQKLSRFLAKYDPNGTERRDLQIYKELVDNDVQAIQSRVSASTELSNPWPWKKHKLAEEWLEFYLDNEDLIERKAAAAQKKWSQEASGQEAGPSQPRTASKPPSSQRKTKTSAPTQRTPFDQADDYNLMQYLAIECPEPKGRKSINTYNKLVEDSQDRWPWASRHPAEAWRERYKKRVAIFDPWILQHQKNLGIDPKEGARSDLWDKVEQQVNVSGRKRKKAPAVASGSRAKPAKQSLKPSSSQTRAPPTPQRKGAKPSRVQESSSESEVDELSPSRKSRVKGKGRVVEQREEEEESEQEQQEREADDRLPVVHEGEEEAEPQDIEQGPEMGAARASDPATQPMQQQQAGDDTEIEDADEEVDELDPSLPPEVKPESIEAHMPSAELIREFNELQESRTSHMMSSATAVESETQDAQEAEDMLARPETQAVEQSNDSELVEQEIDELLSEDEHSHASAPQSSPRRTKQDVKANPKVVIQEPTPPTSDSIESPHLVHASPPAHPPNFSPPKPATTSSHTTSVLRKRTRDDFFEDLESEAQTSTPPRPVKRRALHTIEEGKFGTTSLRELHRPGTAFKNGRRRSGVDELPAVAIFQAENSLPRQETPEWPPKRDKKKSEYASVAPGGPVKARSENSPVPEDDDEEPEDDDEEPNPFYELSQRPGFPGDNSAPTDEESDNGEFSAKRPSQRDMPPPPPPQAGPSRLHTSPEKPHFRPQFSSKDKAAMLNLGSVEAGPSSVRRHTFHHNFASTSSTSSRLGSFSTRPRYSLPATRSASPLAEAAVDGVELVPEDQRLALAAGVDSILRQLAADTGFGIDVVRAAWHRTRRFSLTEAWLRRMCSVVVDHADDVTRDIVGDALDEQDAHDGHDEGSEVYYPPEHSRAWLLEQSRVEESMHRDQPSQEQAPPGPAPSPPRASRVSNTRVDRAQRIREKMRRRES